MFKYTDNLVSKILPQNRVHYKCQPLAIIRAKRRRYD